MIILLALALGAGLFFVLRGGEADLDPYGTPNTYSTPSGTTTPPTSTSTNAMIRVTSPSNNASVASPLTVTGEARGGWYFEASFPIKVLDASGRELGVSYAQAQGEWMTNNFVPFRGTVTFATSTTPTGILVLMKDNPSGLPENDAEVRVPIRFANTTAAMRTVKLYYYDQNRDKDASGNVRCSTQGLVAINRTIALTNTPIQDAVRELLKGPTTSEKAGFPGTEFPLAGVSLISASLSGGVLTLTFSDSQNKTTGGSCRVSILTAQIEATAKQFGGVSSVRLQPPTAFQP